MANQPTKYRKFLAGAATASLVATAVVPSALAAEVSDIANSTHKVAIEALLASEIATGYPDGTFKPNQELTRGNVVKFLGKWLVSLGHEIPADYDSVQRFDDLPLTSEDELLQYAAVVKDAGVFNGSNGNLLATDLIQRQQMATVLVRAYDALNDTNLASYVAKQEFDADVTDLDDARAENRANIAVLDFFDITNPAVSTFKPSDSTTRGQFASFLYRTINTELPIEAGEVVSVSATNGSVVATFSTTTEVAPVSTDLVVTRSINGGATTTVTPTNIAYNDATKAVTFAVPEVAQTDAAQSVTYSVKYKNDAAKSASFTVAAAPVSQVVGYVADAGTQTLTIIYSSPVDAVTATNVNNYSYDADRSSTTNANVSPTGATINTAAVGPYAANQIVTLTFASALVAEDKGSITFSNLKNNVGTVIPTTSLDVKPVATASAIPTLTMVTLTNGSQTGGTISANAGNSVTLTATVNATSADVASVRYRLVRPDNTTTSWTSVPAVDGKFDEDSETATVAINTTGFAGGSYAVQLEAVDAEGKISTTGTAATLQIVATDITAPAVTVTTGTYNPTTTTSVAARTVTVEGTITDTDSNVTALQYRVRQFDASTNAYTTTTDWTTGTAVDGSFNEKAEDYKFTTPQLTNEKSYLVEVRGVDAAGNTGKALPVTVTPVLTTGVSATGGTSTDGTFTLPAATSGDTTAPTTTAVLSVNGVTGAVTNKTNAQVTGTAIDAGNVTKVEYAVYKDTDDNDSYETVVLNYTTTGVTANDGAFNSGSEAYTINYTLPSVDSDYRILVRTTDNSGNTSVTSVDTKLDTTSPIATVTADADTTAKNDFLVTFNENVAFTGTAATAVDGVTSANAFDVDNYTIKQAGQVVNNAVSAITKINDKQYRVTFTSTPDNGQTVNVSSIEDLAGNKISSNPTVYTVNQ